MFKNLLEHAIEAKRRVVEKYENKNILLTSNVWICCIFNSVEGYSGWYNYLQPFMDEQFNHRANGLALHCFYVLDENYSKEELYNNAEFYLTVKTVRLKWLDDLIAAAEKDGDEAELPPIMSAAEIVETYKALIK